MTLCLAAGTIGLVGLVGYMVWGAVVGVTGMDEEEEARGDE